MEEREDRILHGMAQSALGVGRVAGIVREIGLPPLSMVELKLSKSEEK